jgi:LacI family transcriptional regulator
MPMTESFGRAADRKGEMTSPPQRVTMATIAAVAEVSVPTVSRVLNGRADVSAETRLRVQSALGELGYARASRRKATPGRVIDLVTTELSPWATEIISGTSKAALAANCRVVVTVVSEDADVDRWLLSLSSSRTDGVILVLTELSAPHRKRLGALGLPVVIVDPVGQPDPDVLTIGSANWAGGLTATEHLIESGHRRIGTITGSPAILCSQARLDGYRAALERAGIAVDQDLIRTGDHHYQYQYAYESALEAASGLLRLPSRPTAIFAASDVLAMGVYEAARRDGLRVPEDLSVVGFDDVPMAQWVSPPLTTLRQPLAEMATLATRTLLNGESAGIQQRVELATRLIVRASTRPLVRPAARTRGRGLGVSRRSWRGFRVAFSFGGVFTPGYEESAPPQENPPR